MPHLLGSLGYRVGLAGKVHVAPEEVFPFEKVGGLDRNCVRDPARAHVTDGINAFMTRERDEPFCLVVALVEPHVPWVMGDASQYPPHIDGRGRGCPRGGYLRWSEFPSRIVRRGCGEPFQGFSWLHPLPQGYAGATVAGAIDNIIPVRDRRLWCPGGFCGNRLPLL